MLLPAGREHVLRHGSLLKGWGALRGTIRGTASHHKGYDNKVVGDCCRGLQKKREMSGVYTTSGTTRGSLKQGSIDYSFWHDPA